MEGEAFRLKKICILVNFLGGGGVLGGFRGWFWVVDVAGFGEIFIKKSPLFGHFYYIYCRGGVRTDPVGVDVGKNV